MSDIPKCRNKSCPRSQTVILDDTDTVWTLGCLTCRGVQIISKPTSTARARYENSIKMRHRLASFEEKLKFKRPFVGYTKPTLN